MLPCAPRNGKGGGAIIPNHAEYGNIDQPVIDHLGPYQPPDFFGDRVFPNGRNAYQKRRRSCNSDAALDPIEGKVEDVKVA